MAIPSLWTLRVATSVSGPAVLPWPWGSSRFSNGLGDEIRRSAARIAALDCDIFLSTHDFSFGLHEKLAQGRGAFVDPDGCKQYAARVLQRLERRIETEASGNPK